MATACHRATAPAKPYIGAMQGSLVLNVSALVSMLPVSALALKRPLERGGLFWLLLAVAVAGPAVAAIDKLAQGWLSSLSAALWLIIVASLAMFVVVSALTVHGWRLAPLLLPYLFLLGIGAAVTEFVPPAAPIASPDRWAEVHVLVAVLTYGLLTLAAVAGFAVYLQERSLKRRRPSALTALLPSVTDAEQLQIWLLGASALVLGLGLVTGAATQYVETGHMIEVSHKTIFAVTAFVVVVLLLLIHQRTGLRGRRATQFILVAYLLLMLASPGVKLVTDVILARA
jgi:ABC-type uncharacterized transport system permease subunit